MYTSVTKQIIENTFSHTAAKCLTCLFRSLHSKVAIRGYLQIIDFALIEYKIQGATFNNTIVDLKRHSRKDIATHKWFYSIYVQLFRLRTFADLDLL